MNLVSNLFVLRLKLIQNNSCGMFFFRKSVPKFLFKLYKQLSEKDDEFGDDDDANDVQPNTLGDNDGQFTDEHAAIIEKSDIIMTFLNNRE